MGLIIPIYILIICGALIGLIPFGLGKFLHKPRTGLLGLVLCAVSALFHPALPLALAVVFVLAMLLMNGDIRPNRSSAPVSGSWNAYNNRSANIQLHCIAGPLKGRVYSVGSFGLTIGRDKGCAVQLPDSTPGISRCHCAVRFHQGNLALVDLNSAYGTFLGDGTKLPPNYPIHLRAGGRFYLGSPSILFEIKYL